MMGILKTTVTEYAGVNGCRPVSGGVPLPEGAMRSAASCVLLAEDGRSVPLQTQVLGRWRDGSVRWLLLDFMHRASAGSRAVFDLVYGPDVPEKPALPEPEEEPVAAVGVDGHVVVVPGVGDITITAVDRNGATLGAVFQSPDPEVSGPVRRTVRCSGQIQSDDGGHLFSVSLRVSHYGDGGAVRLEPLLLVDSAAGIMQHIRELRLDIVPGEGGDVTIGGPDWRGTSNSTVRLLQVDDETWRLEGGDSQQNEGRRAPGWMDLQDRDTVKALAVRDFREQWPKSLGVSDGALSIGLLPAFDEGTFDHMEPWFKYQYLFEGQCYRLRTGQARRWEIWVQSGTSGQLLCDWINHPLVPAPNPEDAIATGVWGDIAPAGTPSMTDYDPWAERLFQNYCRSIEKDRDYGAMNWGDWFGERRVNWGNHEYDTARQLLIQFARTGDPRYFKVADAAARHSAEVDVIHAVNGDLAEYFSNNWGVKGYPPRPGMVHEHCVGHVGAFYPIETVRKLLVDHGIGHSDHPYLCLDPFNLGHVWTQGMTKHYFLTGDPFVRETVELIGGNLAQLVEDGEYGFGIEDPHFGRAAGWPLLAMAGAYEVAFEDRFLKAMRNLVDRALERQDPCCGGWLYELYPGHCLCTTRKHVGMATFITSILVNGLSEHCRLTGDERIPDCVERAADYMISDTWVEQSSGWRYTSCPASAFHAQPGVVMMAMVNAVRLAGNDEHLRVLRKAWEAKFERLLEGGAEGPGQGKAFTASLYGCAETAGLLTSV